MTNRVNNLVNELESTKATLITAISSIEEDKFNTIPFKDSWTAAQVSEHLLKAIGTGVLYGDTKPTNREPGEKIQQTADLFLNMDIKMTAPDFILPSGDAHTKAQIISDIETVFEKLIQAVKKLDLSATCASFEIPGFGEFTRLEFVYFFMFHTQRHINQLKNISMVLAN
jgi:hypothetical protein